MKNLLKKISSKIKKWYLSLPDRKRYIELITATLSVPMMITVIIVNLYSIKKNKIVTSTATITPIQVVIENPNATNSGRQPSIISTPTPISTLTLTPTPTPTNPVCKKDIGEIEILSPQEGELITKDNLCINISTDNSYCSVTFSYKLDNNDWSDYTTNNNLCFYNLTPGEKNSSDKSQKYCS